MGVIVAALVGYMFFFCVAEVVFYILRSVGLYTIAKKKGIENPWLAWIPFANLYILGKIINDKIELFGKSIDEIGIVLMAGTFICTVVNILANIYASSIALAILFFVLAIMMAILKCVSYYKLFSIYRPNSATVYLILSIIFSVLGSVFVFIIRNDEPCAVEEVC